MMIYFIILQVLTLFLQPVSEQDPVLIDADATEIMDVVRAEKGKQPVLINFWATWCAPCIEEFPYIMELKEEYEGEFKLIFVSGDFPQQRADAEVFLKEQGVDFTTYFKTGKDNEFIQTISSEWTGALPFTIIFDANGEVSSSWEGKAEKEQFESELIKVINP